MRVKKSIIALFLLPSLLIYLAIFLYPTIRTSIMGFYKIPQISSSFSEWSFVGLENYWSLIHNTYFLSSFKNVIIIWILGGAIIFATSFLFAIILNSGVRWKSFWRSLIYLPNTVTAVVMSVVWLHYIYNSRYGFFTTLFKKLGLKSLSDIQWTDNDHLFMSMLLAFSFGAVGYYMLILMAGMDRIPHDFYEAAHLEGASIFHKFFQITLPLLRDVFRTTLVLWTISAMNFFVWSATFGTQESPSTITPGYYMYVKIFGNAKSVYQEELFNVGSGACVGIMITLSIIIGSTIINLFFPKDRLEY